MLGPSLRMRKKLEYPPGDATQPECTFSGSIDPSVERHSNCVSHVGR